MDATGAEKTVTAADDAVGLITHLDLAELRANVARSRSGG